MTEHDQTDSVIPGVEDGSGPFRDNGAADERRPHDDQVWAAETDVMLLPGLVAGFEDVDYDYEQEADVRLLDLLFADMGIRDGLLAPARMWASRQIGYQIEVSPDAYTMGALQRDLWFWLGGYEQALVDLGLRVPDSLNTFCPA